MKFGQKLVHHLLGETWRIPLICRLWPATPTPTWPRSANWIRCWSPASSASSHTAITVELSACEWKFTAARGNIYIAAILYVLGCITSTSLLACCLFMILYAYYVFLYFEKKGRRALLAIWCRRETSAGPAGSSTTPLTTASGTALYCARDWASWLTVNSVPTTSKPATTTRIEVKITFKYQFTLAASRHIFMAFFPF